MLPRRTPHTGHAGLSTDIAPEGIQLSVLLGAGSFGRVYAGERHTTSLTGTFSWPSAMTEKAIAVALYV